MVAIEQFKERRLGSGCTLTSQKLHIIKNILQVLKIYYQFIHPQCGTLTNSCWLCRLEMCESKCRKSLIFVSKLSQFIYNIDKLLMNKLKSLCHNNNICIVTYIT